LEGFFSGLEQRALCADCQRRITRNPLRVLDCKVPGCQELCRGAPAIVEQQCPACDAHFQAVRALLDAAGQDYRLNPRLVRGLDYYTRTTFEVLSGDIGAQAAVAGGGRYDGLLQELGGPDLPGVGFACGLERLALLLPPQPLKALDFYIAALSDAALPPAFLLAWELRRQGLAGECAQAARSMKSQLRQAARLRARTAVILGPDELAAGRVQLKDLETGLQQSLALGDVQTLALAVRQGLSAQ
jgi:histidyl-tRNA synthetase